MNAITPFCFEDQLVRIIDRDGDPWFIAKDVCGVLDIKNHRDAVAFLDGDEKGVVTTDTLGGPQQVLIISEPGFYRLCGISRKPAARRLMRWICHDVLPSIRKTGRYEMPEATQKAPPPTYDDLSLREAMHKLSVVREARHLHGHRAARLLWAELGLPSVAETCGPSGEADATLSLWLSARFAITGQPGDRVAATDMWRSFQDWAAETGAAPLSERAFHLRLAALVATWRCAETGRRIGRVKANSIFYTGLRPSWAETLAG